MYEAGSSKGTSGFRFQGRRRGPKLTDQERAADATRSRVLIDEFIARKGVTICKPGFAVGSRPSQYEGF
ncbi:hypothetical protein ACVIGB_000077 [Bradyrhizobium sp. USDA 4341]